MQVGTIELRDRIRIKHAALSSPEKSVGANQRAGGGIVIVRIRLMRLLFHHDARRQPRFAIDVEIDELSAEWSARLKPVLHRYQWRASKMVLRPTLSVACHCLHAFSPDDAKPIQILLIVDVCSGERLAGVIDLQVSSEKEEECGDHAIGRNNEARAAIIRLLRDRLNCFPARPRSVDDWNGRRRQREIERGPRTFLAVDPDRSSVAIDDLLGDVQAESESTVVRRRDLTAAMEPLEDLIQLVVRNADAAIAHGSHDVIAFVDDVDEDLASLRRILDCIFEKIADHLLEPVAIADDDRIGVGDIEMKATVADRGVMVMHEIAHERKPP